MRHIPPCIRIFVLPACQNSSVLDMPQPHVIRSQRKERAIRFHNSVIWEQFNELKTTKDMVVRLARKQKRQIDLVKDEMQKAGEEIKIIKFELKQAHEKIKELEEGKMESRESDTNENDFSDEDTLDLEMLANDIGTKLAKKEEEETFNYMKKMDMGL